MTQFPHEEVIGTTKIKRINCLLAPGLTQGSLLITDAQVQFGISIVDSRLDDELTVATIQFSDTPEWLQKLNQDQFGFTKLTALGTIWRGVDRTATDDLGPRGARTGKKGTNFLYTEMLPDTDVNVQDTR